METSKPEAGWQRTRVGCEPGQAGRLKILPEPQAERLRWRSVGAPGSSPVTRGAGIQPRWGFVPDEAPVMYGNQGGTAGCSPSSRP